MGDFIQIIKRVGIFMVCAQMLLHLKPSESYGKYIRLLMSVMVLAQLIAPVMELLGRRSNISFEERILFYDEILHESMADADRTGSQAEALLEKMTLEEVKFRINESVEKEESENTTGEVRLETQNMEEVQASPVGADSVQQERLVERIEVKLYD